MAHYAILDENNVVTQVIVGKDEDEPLLEGYNSWEQYYGGKRTSYNTISNTHVNGKTPFRKNYASIGYIYDADLDAFIPPKPYPSWKLNYTTYQWEAPIANPDEVEGYVWRWSEINKEWIKVAVPSA